MSDGPNGTKLAKVTVMLGNAVEFEGSVPVGSEIKVALDQAGLKGIEMVKIGRETKPVDDLIEDDCEIKAVSNSGKLGNTAL